MPLGHALAKLPSAFLGILSDLGDLLDRSNLRCRNVPVGDHAAMRVRLLIAVVMDSTRWGH